MKRETKHSNITKQNTHVLYSFVFPGGLLLLLESGDGLDRSEQDLSGDLDAPGPPLVGMVLLAETQGGGIRVVVGVP